MDKDASVTQFATLKAHLMGLSSLTPIDPEDLATKLGMTERYVNQLLDIPLFHRFATNLI